MKTFDDLEFKPHLGGSGVRAVELFPNGYGVSVIRTAFSYGGDRGLFELGVLKGDENNYDLTYETSVTDDVIGYLNKNEVTKYMKKVQKL